MRKTNNNRTAAFNLYKKHQGKLKSKEIAKILDEKVSNINYWRRVDEWKKKYNPKGGAPLGNKNAVGNNGGAPEKNQNSRKHGWYSKHYPQKFRNIIAEVEEAGGSPIDILWAQIQTLWVNIIHSQKIMYVEDINDMTKELKKEQDGKNGYTKEYEIQFAWDKQASNLNGLSSAMMRLTNMIKKHDEMVHANWDSVTEEQRLRVERLRVQIENPDLEHRKQTAKEKLALDKERLEHTKKMDASKSW